MAREQDKKSPRQERISDLYEYAIEAERATGTHEETEEAARRSLLKRIITITTGAILSVLGILMLVLPGPGMLVLALGLGLLAIDVPFARRWLEIVKKRLPSDDAGKLTKGTIATMVLITTGGLVFSAVSMWWAFFR